MKRNGYDPKKVVDTAKAVVLSKLYQRFYTALNGNDTKTMDQIGREVGRVGGTLKGLEGSMQAKRKQYGKGAFVSGEQEAIAEAFK